MRGPAPHTADDADRSELWRASFRLLLICLPLALLVVPLLRELPLGPTGRTSLLAWLLVAVAVYWLYAGLGYQALLLLQLVTFSAASVLLTTKVALVLVGIDRLSVLRHTHVRVDCIRSATALIRESMRTEHPLADVDTQTDASAPP